MHELPKKLPDGRVVIRDGNLVFLSQPTTTSPETSMATHSTSRLDRFIDRTNLRRKGTGIAFAATLLASLVAIVAVPTTTPANSIDGLISGVGAEADGRFADPIEVQVFPKPAPGPTT